MNKSFIIAVLILVLLFILAVMYPNANIRFMIAVVCFILWFIAGYNEGKKN